MRPKFMVWTGVGIILLTLGILLFWAFMAGLLPSIEIRTAGWKIIPPRLDIRALNLLDLAARTIVVPLKMFAALLQVSLQQLIDAFRFHW